MQFIKFEGPSELTPVRIIELPIKWTSNLSEIQQQHRLSDEDLVDWRYTYVTPRKISGKYTDASDARRAYRDRENVGGARSPIVRRLGNVGIIGQDLMNSLQSIGDRDGHRDAPWIVAIEFTIRLYVSGEGALVKEGTHKVNGF